MDVSYPSEKVTRSEWSLEWPPQVNFDRIPMRNPTFNQKVEGLGEVRHRLTLLTRLSICRFDRQ